MSNDNSSIERGNNLLALRPTDLAEAVRSAEGPMARFDVRLPWDFEPPAGGRWRSDSELLGDVYAQQGCRVTEDHGEFETRRDEAAAGKLYNVYIPHWAVAIPVGGWLMSTKGATYTLYLTTAAQVEEVRRLARRRGTREDLDEVARQLAAANERGAARLRWLSGDFAVEEAPRLFRLLHGSDPRRGFNSPLLSGGALSGVWYALLPGEGRAVVVADAASALGGAERRPAEVVMRWALGQLAAQPGPADSEREAARRAAQATVQSLLAADPESRARWEKEARQYAARVPADPRLAKI